MPGGTFKQNSIILMFWLVMTLGLFGLMATPDNHVNRVAVFLPPWAAADEMLRVISNADGLLVFSGRWSWIAVAQSDDPEFSQKLYRAGALFIGKAGTFSLCFTSQNRKTQADGLFR